MICMLLLQFIVSVFCLVCLDDLLYGINAFSAYLLRFIPGALILTLFFSILRVAD